MGNCNESTTSPEDYPYPGEYSQPDNRNQYVYSQPGQINQQIQGQPVFRNQQFQQENQNVLQQVLPRFIKILDPQDQIVKDFVQKKQQQQQQQNTGKNTRKNVEYIVNGQEKRIAYIIGNDDYSNDQNFKNLRGVQSEVQDFDNFPNQICINTLLKKCQFECRLFRNVTKSNFTDIQDQMEVDIAKSKGKGKNINEKIVIMFVYLGHGISIIGSNDIYAVTSDSKFFSLEFVPSLSSFYSNCQIISLIDCCRQAMSEEIFTKLGGIRNLDTARNYDKIQALNYIQIKAQVQQSAVDFCGITDTFKNQVMLNGSKQLGHLFLDMQKEYDLIELTLGKTTDFQFYHAKKEQQQYQQIQQIFVDNNHSGFMSIEIKGMNQFKEFCSLLKENKIQKDKILKAFINLDMNNIKAEGAQYVSDALKTLKNLNHLELNLFMNNIKAECAQYVSDALKTLKNLNHLELNLLDNDIKDKGAQYVSDALKTLKNLNHLELNLSKNDIKGEGAQYVSDALKTLKNLNHLELYLSQLLQLTNKQKKQKNNKINFAILTVVLDWIYKENDNKYIVNGQWRQRGFKIMSVEFSIFT